MAKLIKYIVIALTISGKRNKVYRANDIVTANDLPSGAAESYLASGHLAVHKEIEVEDFVPEVPEVPEETKIESNDLDNLEDLEASGETNEVTNSDETKESNDSEVNDLPNYDEITKAEIVKILLANGTQFNPAQTKQELYDLLKK